jgi:phosphoglycerate kinase
LAFNKKTIKDWDLRGKRVLMRADYNVPVAGGKITDDYRIRQSLPTIKYILEQDAKLVIISHLGRPTNAFDKSASLTPVAKRLGELLDTQVAFAPDCIGDEAKAAADRLQAGHILVLENVRFHPEEEKNDPKFAQAIVDATGAEVFVQDGFGVVHRAHASTDAIARIIPGVAGFLLEREVDTITRVMEDPERPFVAVVGGAKISDKIEVLERLIKMADLVAVGGAMANDFLAAEGYKLGKSLLDRDSLAHAKRILAMARAAEKERNFNFLVPVDAVVSTSIDGTRPTRLVDFASNSLADIEAYPKKPLHNSYSIKADEMVLDIGPMSAYQIAGAIRLSSTVVWNGTMGVTETKGIAGAHPPFAHATKIVVEAMIGLSNRHKNKAFTLVGGGDTVGYVEQEGLVEDFSHVSTGGGASLELMSGHKLPGVEVLWDK